MKSQSINAKKTKQKPSVIQDKTWDLTIGSDFELFIQDKQSGQFVSSLDIFDGKDKYDPFVVDEYTKFFCDNVLFEGNVKFATTKKELVDNFRFTLTKMVECLYNIHGDKYKLIADAAHNFDDNALNHPKAREAGCSVSYNAHTMGMSEPAPFTEVNTRTSALHYHFGRSDFQKVKQKRGEILLDFHSRNNVILLSDLFIGNTMNLIDNDAENSVLRRKYYGKAGELRIPPFGVEYRTLHSYFLRHPLMVELVFDLSMEMFKHIKNKEDDSLIQRFNMETLATAINNNNREVSEAIFNQLKLPDNIVEQVEHHKKINYNPDVITGWNINTNIFHKQQTNRELVGYC